MTQSNAMPRLGSISVLPITKAFLLVAIFALPIAAAPAKPPIRVAMLTGPGGESLGSVADFVAADLRGDAGLQLLERQEIGTVLAEHQLASDGLTDPASAVAAGKLLSVDVFAVLDVGPAGAGLVVYDARSGLRLADQVLAGKTADQQTAEVVAALRESLVKQKAITHPLCLLTVRNADLGSSMDSFCDGIGQILERRLLTSRDVTILERRYLDQVNRERALPTSRPSMPLIPSLQFLELEISRGKEQGTYAATVVVSDSNGNKLGRVDVTAGEPGTLVQQLLDRLITKLGATSPQPPDPVRESMRFAFEADFFHSHRQAADALVAAEAAFALDPKGRDNPKRLAEDLIEAARQSDSLQVSLPQATRAFDLCVDAVDPRHKPLGLFDGSDFFPAESAIGYFISANFAAQQDPRFSADYESLRIRFHDWMIARVRLWAAASPDAANVQQSTNHLWGTVMPALRGSVNTLRDYARDLDDVVGKQWLPAYDAVTGVKWDAYGYMNLQGIVKGIFMGYEPTDISTFSSAFFPRWIRGMKDYAGAAPPLYEKLARSHDPALQLCGKAGEIWCETISKDCPVTDFEKRFQPVADFAKSLIANPATTPEARERIYLVWEMAIELFFGNDPYVNHYHQEADHDRAMDILRTFRKSRDEDPKPPVNDKPSTMPWARADRICDVRETPGLEGIEHLIRPFMRDGSVWVIGVGRNNVKAFIQLFRLPLVEGPTQRLARLDYDPGYPPDIRAAISQTCYWFATRDAGLLAFPRDGSPGFFVNSNNGLPTNHVDSVACCDGMIFAGLGQGGYIVRYDPKTSRCDVLASSRRKDKHSPLDDCLAYEVPCMVADTARHRVLLYEYEINGRPSGIWQIDATGRISELYETRNVYNSAWCSEVDGSHVIFSGNAWALDLDLQTDQPTALHSHLNWPIGPKIVLGPNGNTPDLSPIRPLLYRDGYLWSGYNFTRASIDTGRVQDLPNMRSSAVEERVIPTEVLQLFDNGRHALMGDQLRLWKLTFETGNTPETRP
jgi:hypothetical protein